ncbi:unnamed protein product [Sphagnum compactum]
MNHPLYPWVDPRNRQGTGHCRRRPGLPVSSALLLAGSLAMACCFPRWHASLLPRRVCVFPLGFVFLCYGELRGEMSEGSTQAVELESKVLCVGASLASKPHCLGVSKHYRKV